MSPFGQLVLERCHNGADFEMHLHISSVLENEMSDLDAASTRLLYGDQ